MNNPISEAIAAKVVSPLSKAGRSTWSVAQPSAKPPATVIAPYSMAASTDSAKMRGSSQIATRRTASPLPGDAALVGDLRHGQDALQDSQVRNTGHQA